MSDYARRLREGGSIPEREAADYIEQLENIIRMSFSRDRDGGISVTWRSDVDVGQCLPILREIVTE